MSDSVHLEPVDRRRPLLPAADPPAPFHVVLDRSLPQRVRARRWQNGASRVSHHATAHDGVELAWLDGGAAHYRLGARDVVLEAGSVMVVPAGVEHATDLMPAMRGGSLHVDSDVIAQAADAAGRAAFTRVDAGLLEAGADVGVLGAMLVDELARRSRDADRCAAALVDAIAVKAVRGLPLPSASPRDPRVRAAVDVIRARFADDIDVDDIAAACGMSRFHLSRLFKAATGTSPYQYLLDVRLDESATRLRRGQTVTEAALSSGFADLSRYARMFAKKFGVLPKVYAAAHTSA